ncbi:MAG: hypothetical protein M1296_03665 [Chloroflexi bacterium]|nr:hypothetical protein [Chloroflexota bacterium]
MINTGMEVISRDGHVVGTVNKLVGDSDAFAPGLILDMPVFLGLRRRQVALTTYDVSDVSGATVLLRISRWDVRNREPLAVVAARSLLSPVSQTAAI